jgi:hypothetical protein
MTRESYRPACALWLQSGINAEVLYTPRRAMKKKKEKKTHEVRTRTRDRMQTHDDNFSSGVGAQDDTPGVSSFVLLETKHAYTQAKWKKIN